MAGRTRCRPRRGDGQTLRALWPVLLLRPDLRRVRSDEPDRALGGGPLAYHGPGDLDRWRTVPALPRLRSEEHTSELQSLMRISYAVFCLKKKKTIPQRKLTQTTTKQ